MSVIANSMNSAGSFVLGYNYGRAQGVELTPREIAIQFPDVEPLSFANGNIDGISGDRFRLDLTLGGKWRPDSTSDDMTAIKPLGGELCR